jgi:UDP-GlcNAc:undecaprenyl-phosphate/decaprenyl-phosphate GlcNAc-1-phosphate transferase
MRRCPHIGDLDCGGRSSMSGLSVTMVIGIAFALSCVLTWLLTTHRARAIALDEPNQRSLHQLPIPRTGGLAIMAATLAAWLTLGSPVHRYVFIAALVLSALSLVDDVRSLPVTLRLLAHLVAAGAVVAALDPQLPLLLWIGAILAIAWMINLYNFMDGSDGLAGGMALFGFLFYAWAAWRAGDTSFAFANACVAASAAGFLVFNFHPARIFMGDSGSVPLGLLAAAFGMRGWAEHIWPVWFPVLVFSPFIVDSSVTLARRAWQRQRLWQAHRDHYYQRLVQLGWGHRSTALAEYAVMILCGVAGVYAIDFNSDAQSVVLGATALLYMFAMLAVDATWRTSAGAPP